MPTVHIGLYFIGASQPPVARGAPVRQIKDACVIWKQDHVVLETKARPRRKPTRDQKDSEVFFDGQTLQFPWCDDRKAAGQVERNAHWVRESIAAFPPKGVPVEPVIVVPGWYVTPRGKYPIKVMNATYLVGYLKGVKPIFTRAQLDPVIARLDERCRTLEF